MKTPLILLLVFTASNVTAQFVGVGTTNPLSQLSVGSSSEFRVNATGDITRINNVPYTHPSIQGANGKTLVNDGSGNMNWKEAGVPIGSIIFCNASDTASLISKGFVITGISQYYFRTRYSTIGTWSVPASGINLTGGIYFQDNPSVWTGTEMLSYDNNIVYRWNPSTTVWTASSVNTVPGFLSVTGASAIWTGTDMIIYGGVTSGGVYSNLGVKYNPAANTWTAIANSLNKKAHHTAVWTGTDMIVWGGDSTNSVTGYSKTVYKFTPGTNTWSPPISSASSPTARSNAGAVWTGSKMIIFAGNTATSGSFNDCYTYDPSLNSWTTNAGNFYPQGNIKCIWTGNEMLTWGSYYNANLSTNYPMGWVYTPSTNTWTRFSTEGAGGNLDHRSNVVWTGSLMWVVRGSGAQSFTYTGSGYSFDPAFLTSNYIMTKVSQN